MNVDGTHEYMPFCKNFFKISYFRMRSDSGRNISLFKDFFPSPRTVKFSLTYTKLVFLNNKLAMLKNFFTAIVLCFS
jgi:hypothetical protein